jgi:molybdenum cofactor cytidylyltransferase
MNEAANQEPKVGGVLLAAGASTRLGQPKQLLIYEGEPLVRRIARQALASRVASLVVVVGNQAEQVRDSLAGLDLQIVENPDFLQGQSTSLKAGLGALAPDLAAAMVLLVDQPFVDAELIDQLIARYAETGALIVAPQHGGRRGNPVLFDRAIIPELLTVVGDVGAREIIGRHRNRLATLELPSDRAFLDVDTWEDYERLSRPQ